jgi:hypothetical protein
MDNQVMVLKHQAVEVLMEVQELQTQEVEVQLVDQG